MTDKTTAEREAFEAWHRRKFGSKYDTGQPTRDKHNGVYDENYGPKHQQLMWESFQAGRASLPLPGAQEAVGYLWQHCETGRTRVVLPDQVFTADACWIVVGPLTLGAAPQPALSAGWRDISTVPKDGTEIILRRGTRVGAAQWCHWPGDEFEEAGAGWTVCWDGDSWDGAKAPTHWQSLPVEPSMDGESNG